MLLGRGSAQGAAAESSAWDAGRVDGLKQACEIVQDMMEVESITT